MATTDSEEEKSGLSRWEAFRNNYLKLFREQDALHRRKAYADFDARIDKARILGLESLVRSERNAGGGAGQSYAEEKLAQLKGSSPSSPSQPGGEPLMAAAPERRPETPVSYAANRVEAADYSVASGPTGAGDVVAALRQHQATANVGTENHIGVLDSLANKEVPIEKGKQKAYANSFKGQLGSVAGKINGIVANAAQSDRDTQHALFDKVHTLREKAQEAYDQLSDSDAKRLMKGQLNTLAAMEKKVDKLAGNELTAWNDEHRQMRIEKMAEGRTEHRGLELATKQESEAGKNLAKLQERQKFLEQSISDPQFRQHARESNRAFTARKMATMSSRRAEFEGNKPILARLESKHEELVAQREVTQSQWNNVKDEAAKTASRDLAAKELRKAEKERNKPAELALERRNQAVETEAQRTEIANQANEELKGKQLDAVFNMSVTKAKSTGADDAMAGALAGRARENAERIYNYTKDLAQSDGADAVAAGRMANAALGRVANLSPDEMKHKAEHLKIQVDQAKAVELAKLNETLKDLGFEERKINDSPEQTLSSLKQENKDFAERKEATKAYAEAIVQKEQALKGASLTEREKHEKYAEAWEKTATNGSLANIKQQAFSEATEAAVLTELRSETEKNLALGEGWVTLSKTDQTKLINSAMAGKGDKAASEIRVDVQTVKLDTQKIQAERANLAQRVKQLDTDRNGEISEREAKALNKLDPNDPSGNKIDPYELEKWAGSKNFAKAAKDLGESTKNSVSDIALALTSFMKAHGINQTGAVTVDGNQPASVPGRVGAGKKI